MRKTRNFNVLHNFDDFCNFEPYKCMIINSMQNHVSKSYTFLVGTETMDRQYIDNKYLLSKSYTFLVGTETLSQYKGE